MCIMLSNLYARIFGALEHFLSTKTKRERYLLSLALILCMAFVMIEFVYMPLFERFSALQNMHKSAHNELKLSLDSVNHTKMQHLEQTQALQAHIEHINENLALLQSHISPQEPPLNPFSLISQLIAFAKAHSLNLTHFAPYPALNALRIQGVGDFAQFIALLEFIESYPFFSLDTIHLMPKDSAQMGFELLIVDYHLNPFIQSSAK